LARNFTVQRVQTYLFGVAIGCVLVVLILIAKANMSGRALAKAEAEAARAASDKAAAERR
jgi:hypothetical protein